jgi:hypothetical protein
LGRARCCKSGGISDNFGAAGTDVRPLGTVRMKILFHNVASKPDGCTIIAVFEVKKEIPVQTVHEFTIVNVDKLTAQK